MGKVKELYRVAATYDGGHPAHLKRSRGDLVLYPDGVEMAARRDPFVISLYEVLGCDLQPAQWGLWRTALSNGKDRALQEQRTVAVVRCYVGGVEYEVRFTIRGALTAPGAARKAQQFKDRLYTLRPGFATPGGQAPVAAASPAAPAPGDDIYAQIRKLASLRDDGLVSDDEFSLKKAELLARL